MADPPAIGAAPAYCLMSFPQAAPGQGWRNLGEQPVYETPWFRLRQARVELPGGRQLDHYLLRLPPLTQMAMLDEDHRVLLLWRHRFVPDTWSWELPSGIAGPDTDLAAEAIRQALAECGWEAVSPRPLLTLQQNGGLTDSAVHVFRADSARYHGEPEADFEAGRIEWIALAEVPAMLAAGLIKDASTAAALLCVLHGLTSRRPPA
jgi:ADP-ribose pyrophosphatase YjhB (NUDIX family)